MRVRPRWDHPRVPARRLLSLRSESGQVTAGAIIAVALLLLIVYLVLAALKGDAAYYGSVPIPSKGAPIELDSGQVDVSYAEEPGPDNENGLQVPDDITYEVVDGEGGGVSTDLRTSDEKDSDAGTAKQIGAIQVPDDGTYYVTADSPSAGQRVAPALAFGLSPTGAVRVRFLNIVDHLNGPLGIVVAGVLLLLFLMPSIERWIRRRNRIEYR
jgi:hypothetical protein